MDNRLKEIISCQICGGELDLKQDFLHCNFCSKDFEIKDGKVFFATDTIIPKALKGVLNPKKWTILRKRNYDFYKEQIKSFYKNNQTWIDLGVGPAQFRDLFPKEASIFGIDFAPYEKADIVSDFNNKIPIKSDSVEGIFASNVFEHVYGPDFLLKESCRILKNGGVMLASTPFLLMEHQGPYDYFRYTRHLIDLAAKNAGFDVISIIPLGSRKETLKTTWFHFIKRTLDAHEDEKSKLPVRYKILSKILTISFLFLMFFVDKLKKSDELDPLFTLGYGFVLIKRKN